MLQRFKFLLAVLFFGWTQFYSLHSIAQVNYRIEADYSIKKIVNGKQSLTVGKVYFDLNHNKLVFLNSFPQKETIVLTPEFAYLLPFGQEPKKQPSSPQLIQLNVLNLLLKGELNNFGLPNYGFNIVDLEETDTSLITTWQPPQIKDSFLGNILIMQSQKRINGVVSMNSTNTQPINKQWFRDYKTINNIEVPHQVVQFTYDIKGTVVEKQITEYKNIKLNNIQNENWYNYTLPSGL